MTRARDDLVLLYDGKPSPFLAAVREHLARSTVELQRLEVSREALAPASSPLSEPTKPTYRPPVLVDAGIVRGLAQLTDRQAIDVLVSRLRGMGLDVVDKTWNGGCLWLGDTDAARDMVDRLRQGGLVFYHAGFSRALQGPGWFLKPQSLRARY